MEVELEEPTVEGGAAALPGSAEEEVANFPVPFSPGSMALTYEQNFKQTEAEVDLMFPKSLNSYISTPNCINFDSCAVCEAYALCPYGCGSVLSQAPPPPPVTYPFVAACCYTPLSRMLAAGMPYKRTFSQRCLSHASRFCYKPMSRNGRPRLLQTQCF